MSTAAQFTFPTLHTAQLASSTAARPLTGIFETLIAQHREVLDLLREAAANDGARRHERWLDARRRLLAHERAETGTLYSQLEGFSDAKAMLDSHRLQAEEFETAVHELDALEEDADAWIPKLRDLLALLDDHVRDEELDVFPAAQRWLGENTARELESTYTTAQREVLHELATRPPREE